MYLKASPYPKFDPIVQTIQMKLNAINCQVHGNWPYLQTDGLFGEKTKQAVKSYQLYRNITPVSGEIGDTTLRYIYDSYNQIPQLRSADTTFKAYKQKQIDIDWTAVAAVTTDFLKRFADSLNGISKNIENEIKRFKSQKVSPKDVDLLMKRFFGRPDVLAMRKAIEDEMWNDLKQQARGNTNVYNTPNKTHHISNAKQIGEAQRQVAKGVLNPQNRNAVEKQLAEQLQKKIIEELESANFKNKITNTLKSKGVPKVTGGGILKTIMLFPLFKHFVDWVVAYGKPNAATAFNTLISDLISLIEGVLIGWAVGAVVTAIGLVGWVAVVVALVVAIIIGIIIEIFFPNHSEWLAEKIISATKNLINSPVFQEAARTSFV